MSSRQNDVDRARDWFVYTGTIRVGSVVIVLLTILIFLALYVTNH